MCILCRKLTTPTAKKHKNPMENSFPKNQQVLPEITDY